MTKQNPTTITNSDRSVFFSHSSTDSAFVLQVAGYLNRCFSQIYCYEEHQKTGDYVARMQRQLVNSSTVVFFVGAKTSNSHWQQKEISTAEANQKFCIPVQLPDANGEVISIPEYAVFQTVNLAIQPMTTDSSDALATALEICRRCGI